VTVAEKQLSTSQVHIKVNGSPLPEAQMRRVNDVVVERSLHVPSMFVIQLLDVGDDANQQRAAFFRILDQDAFAVGYEVQIDLGRESDPETVIKGEITSIEVEVTQEHGPLISVRGYDRSHRLHRGRQSRSFLNQSDSDIVRKVAQEVQLQANTDSTTTHDYVFQDNQTNWEFLKERAVRVGFELFVDDRTLHFRKPQNGKEQGPDQKLWENLLSLRVKLSSTFQAKEVIVKAWDPKTKQAIIGKASNGQLAPKTGISKTGAQIASTFGDAKVYVVNRPVDSQAEADAMAKAVYDDLDGAFVQAEGVCLGDAAIMPGVTVKMDRLGTRFSGNYYVTSATHTLNAEEGYRTTFVVSGRQTNSLLELLQPKGDGPSAPSVVVGVVTNNTDPDNLGRVKVKFPWLADDESWWARIATPWAGKGQGLFFLPEVGDEVLVSFEHGDITRPFMLGALWNGKDLPPQKASTAVQSSKVTSHLIHDGQDFLIQWDSRPGEEKLSIRHHSSSTIIRIIKKDNSVLIKADGPINIEAGGDVNVKAAGDASVEAGGSLSLEGQGNVSVESGASMSIKATGLLTIKGAQVQIN